LNLESRKGLYCRIIESSYRPTQIQERARFFLAREGRKRSSNGTDNGRVPEDVA